MEVYQNYHERIHSGAMSALQARRVSPSLLSRSLEHLLKKDTQALRFKVLLIRRVCSESLKSVQYTIGQYRALDSIIVM